ncbi:MAG: hypothetical protein U5K37_05620 [Natrialbaceae archaeon]|nr:hypothetical protein [Natrialbaceae archaeon]
MDRLDPGIHVAVNVGLDGATDELERRSALADELAANATTLRSALEREPAERVDPWLDRAGEALGNHDYEVCIHRNGFGTRSSSLIGLGETPRYAFAPGPPCETPYEAVDLEGHL